MNAVETVRQVYELYGKGDIDGALGFSGPDVRFIWKADPALVRFGGTGEGPDAFRKRLYELHEVFEYHSFRATSVFGEGDRVAAETEMDLTHRASGRRFSLQSAHFWTVRGGKIVELVEYYDTATVANIEKAEIASAA